MRTQAWAVLLAGVLALGLGGCKSAPAMGRYNVEVSMDPELTNRTGGTPQVLVDLVGVNDMDYPRWSSESMSKYWDTGSDSRGETAGVRHSMAFGQGNSGTKVLSKTDKIWDTWKERKVMHLLVLADVPGAQADRPGSEDGRRLVLPLDRSRWKGRDTIKVVVQRSRVTTTTPPDPVKK